MSSGRSQAQAARCLPLVKSHRDIFNSPSNALLLHIQSLANQESSSEPNLGGWGEAVSSIQACSTLLPDLSYCDSYLRVKPKVFLPLSQSFYSYFRVRIRIHNKSHCQNEFIQSNCHSKAQGCRHTKTLLSGRISQGVRDYLQEAG